MDLYDNRGQGGRKKSQLYFRNRPYTLKVSHRDSWIYFGLILGELSIYPKTKGVEFGTCRGLISEGGCLKVDGFTEMGPNRTCQTMRKWCIRWSAVILPCEVAGVASRVEIRGVGGRVS